MSANPNDDTLKSIKSINTSLNTSNDTSSPNTEFTSSTPEKRSEQKQENNTTVKDKEEVSHETNPEKKLKPSPKSEDSALHNAKQNNMSPTSSKQESKNFIQNERNSPKKSIQSPKKIGRNILVAFSKAFRMNSKPKGTLIKPTLLITFLIFSKWTVKQFPE